MQVIAALSLISLFWAGPARAEGGPEPRWVDLLKTIVEINSGTKNIEGLEKVRAVLTPEFEALGFKATVYPVGEGHKVLSLEFPDAKPELMLVGHIDTVFPTDSRFQKFTPTEDGFSGPGTIDMKGGDVLMINSLAILAQKDKDLLRRIRVVLNDDEEIGSLYSGDKMKELAKGLKSALVFEPGLSDGALVTAHSGMHWIELKVHGKASHAGLEPEKGVNACVELGSKIEQINALADYPRRLTVNPDVISGGTATNVICEEASAKIDIRYVEQADLDRLLTKLDKILKASTVKSPATGQTPTAEIVVLNHSPSMPERHTKRLFELAKIAGPKVGQAVSGRPVGYGSDANGLAQTGIDLLVGLGTYGGGLHTDTEHMTRKSYEERIKFAPALIQTILSGPPSN